jgi:hypothetical protein
MALVEAWALVEARAHADAKVESDVEANANADIEDRISQAPSITFDDFIEGKGRGLIILLQYGSSSHFNLDMLTCI